MADDPQSLGDRAAQLISDLEHASANNAPISPVMLAQLRALVSDALAEKTTSEAAQAQMGQSLTAAQQQAKQAEQLAQHIQLEVGQLTDTVGHIAPTS